MDLQLIAKSITRKSNKASDLMFLDVIQAHETEKLGTKEGTSSMVEEKGREYLGQVENEHVEQLVSLPEAEMFLHKVISNVATDETSINEQSHMQEFAQVVGDEKTTVCETSQRVFGTEPPDESASNDLSKTNPTQVDNGQDYTVSPQLVISLGHVG